MRRTHLFLRRNKHCTLHTHTHTNVPQGVTITCKELLLTILLWTDDKAAEREQISQTRLAYVERFHSTGAARQTINVKYRKNQLYPRVEWEIHSEVYETDSKKAVPQAVEIRRKAASRINQSSESKKKKTETQNIGAEIKRTKFKMRKNVKSLER